MSDRRDAGGDGQPPRGALVLSGGLFRNAFQVGVLEALHARGFRPELVIGVSSGAWNGACLVAGQIGLMRPFWRAVASLPKVSLANTRANRTFFNIRAIIREVPETHLDFDAIARSETRFLVGATRLPRFEFELLQLNGRSDAEVFDGLMASNLIPGLSGWPVKLNGNRFIDGGFTNRVPYEAALAASHQQVIVVVPDHDRVLRKRPGARHTTMPEERALTIVAPRRPLPWPGSRPDHIEAAMNEGYAVGLHVPY